MHTLDLSLHLGSAVLAGIAAFWSLSLASTRGNSRIWFPIAAAFVIMAAERVSEILLHGLAIGPLLQEKLSDILIFITLALLLAGVLYCRNLFLEFGEAKNLLGRQFDEKLRNLAFLPESGTDGERRKLVQAQHEWLNAFDMLAMPAFIYDQSYRIVNANRAYADRAGLSLKELAGKPYYEIFPKLDRPILDSLTKPESGVAESEVRLVSGETIRSLDFPVYGENREYRYSLHILEDLTRHRQMENSVRRTRMAIKMAANCIAEMIHAQDELHLLQAVCKKAVEAGGFRIAWIGYAEKDGSIRVPASHGYKPGFPPDLLPAWIPEEKGFGPAGQAIRTGKTVIARNLLLDPELEYWKKDATRNGYASMAGFPLIGREAVFGVFCLGAEEPFAFLEEEASVLEIMASTLSFGVTAFRASGNFDESLRSRIHYLEPLRKSLEDAVEAVASAMQAHVNPYAAGHQSRVADIAAAIALEMGLPEEQARGLHLAGILHDIGESGISDRIFVKTDELTEAERNAIKRHPQAGHDILEKVDFPWPLAEIVLQHHERLDGSGYPRGLKDDQILLGARIIAVADTIEALAFGQRPNHPRMGIPAALVEVEKNRGKLYDGAIVDAALRLFREKGLAIS